MLLKKNIWLKLFTIFVLAFLVNSCSNDDDSDSVIIVDPDPFELEGEIDFIKTYGGSGEDETVSIIPLAIWEATFDNLASGLMTSPRAM